MYNSDLRVRTRPDGLYTYPDVTEFCGKAIPMDDAPDVIVNPRVVFEILSPSTEAKDRGVKFQQYKRIDALEEYVVSQSEPSVERYSRSSAGSLWTDYREASGPEAKLDLRSLGIEIALADLYRGFVPEA